MVRPKVKVDSSLRWNDGRFLNLLATSERAAFTIDHDSFRERKRSIPCTKFKP